jgi:PEP-CTERM motif
VRNRIFLSSIAVLAIVIAANADIIKITGVDNGTIANITEVGSSDPQFGGPSYSGGVYTGLYNAVDLTTGKSWLTYCIDPIGDIDIGDQWNTNLTTGSQLATGDAGILSTDAYGASSNVTVEKYEMISYLADKYYYDQTSSNPMAVTNNGSTAINDRNDLSLAFWEISRDFNGQSTSLNLSSGDFQVNSGDLTYTKTLLADAYNSLGKSPTVDLAVYSPTQRPSQEFIALGVPEPGTLSIVGISLLGMVGFAALRRRRK